MPKMRKNNSHYLGGAFLKMPVAGTPANAVAPYATLTFSGVVVHGETVTVGDDTYQFAADTALTVDEGNLAVDINAVTVKAHQTLTVPVNPTANDTMTVGAGDDEVTYTFKAEAVEDTDIEIGDAVADTQANIVLKLNERDDITCTAFADNVATLTAVVGGAAGNSIATTETFTAETNVFGGVALASGADCSNANAKAKLLLVTHADPYYTKAAGSTGESVKFTGTIKGTLLERIECAETCDNGTFDVAHLDNGVDSVAGVKGDIMIDATHLHILTADQGIDGTNWKKVAFA